MPFKMKGSPFRVEGVIKTTAEKEAERIANRDAQVAKEIQTITDRKNAAAEVETAKRHSKGLYTKAELAAKKAAATNKPTFVIHTSSSKSGSGSANSDPTPKSPPSKTPAPSKTPEATSGNKKDYFASTARALTAYSLKSDNNKGVKGAAVKEFAGTAEFLNARKDVSFTPGYKSSSNLSKEKAETTKSTEAPKSRKKMKADKMANKVSDAPKSRKEMRMAKASNKALKARETAASSTKMESRMAAGAKAKRLEKRAGRIAERIERKNKK